MSIEATKFHNAAKNHARYTNSKYLQALAVAQWDYYFNRAKELVLENYIAVDETNSIISHHLLPLKKRKVTLEFIVLDNHVIATYPKDQYKLIRQIVQAENDCCEGQKRDIIVRILASDKIDEARKSVNWKPSWEYEETIGYHSADGLIIHHDKQFDIIQVEVDYIRKASDIRAPSLAKSEKYIDETGKSITKDSAFDVDSTFLWRKIVDVAVLIALRDDNKVQNFQTQLQTILFGESAYIYPVERT